MKKEEGLESITTSMGVSLRDRSLPTTLHLLKKPLLPDNIMNYGAGHRHGSFEGIFSAGLGSLVNN